MRAALTHALRIAVVATLLAMLYRPAQQPVEFEQPPELSLVQRLLPDATRIDHSTDATGTWAVFSSDGTCIARVARTMPEAKSVRGYRGPTEALILLNNDYQITAVDVLASRDTLEHLAAVRNESPFLNQFVGWNFAKPDPSQRVDGVSGATLTSLAMAGGILARLGVTPGSLVFPDELTENEKLAFANLPLTDNRQTPETSNARIERSGLWSDDIVGYQGPTELLLLVSNDNILRNIQLRRSYDNQPYVDYVREEEYFWDLFRGKSLAELAAWDLAENDVEGVSGATMTSQAVARTILATATAIEADQVHQRKLGESRDWLSERVLDEIKFSTAELMTIALVLSAGMLSRLGLHRQKSWRRAWLILTAVLLGFWSGNLVSMSLLAGWASEGIAWLFAPGLTFLTVVALTAPPIRKSNPYCNHLCPHGAIQQLVRPPRNRRWHWKLNAKTQNAMKHVPPITLIIAYLAVLLRPSTDLASWEPFHAYLYPIASTGAIVLFIASLLFSAFVPMGYCRFGCPTGSLLDYLRRTAASNRFTRADAVALFLLAVALTTRLA
jgi:NosR/NirI family transcriptional regulator, nitrous oxide reductase regulator